MWIIAVHSCIIAGITFLWYRSAQKTKSAHWLISALVIKIACGWLVGTLYLQYYAGGDTWNYFTDGVKLAELARSSSTSYLSSWFGTDNLPPGLQYSNQPRALLMSRLVSVGCLLTNDNYWLISVYFSLLSAGGIWHLVQTINRLFPRTVLAARFAWFAYPSFVFWSSGILKETLAVGLISVLVAESLRFYYDENKRKVLYSAFIWAVAAILLWLIKYYYAAVLLPILIALTLAPFVPTKRLSLSVKTLGLFGLLIGFATALHPNLEIDQILEVVVQNHDTFVQISDDNSLIHFYRLQPTIYSFVVNSPLALFSAWYRPLPFEIDTLVGQLAGLENILLLLTSLFALRKIKIIKEVDIDKRLWITALLLFAVLLGVLLALSTPNFGTLSRYRVAFSPFILYLFLVPLFRQPD